MEFAIRLLKFGGMVVIAALAYYLILGIYSKHCQKGSKLVKVLKYLFLLILGGSIYYGIEILWRGYSHFSMFIVGGLCFILMGLVNEILSWDTYFELQVIYGVLSTLVLEFVSGCIINLWLKLDVWDYSHMPFNLFGQICITYAFLWIPIVVIGILLDDYARYKLLGEEKPHYRFWIVEHFKKNK